MNIQQIAKRLAALCAEGKYEQAQKELYADNAVSIEPEATPAFAKETRGLKAIIEKGRKFESMLEKLHGTGVSEPVIGGNSFAISMWLDATMQGRGRVKMEEVCVYTVKDGKIVAEQFFM